MLRKLLTWGFIIFIVYYLVNDPHGAAHAAQSALNGLQHAGSSLSTFVSGL